LVPLREYPKASVAVVDALDLSMRATNPALYLPRQQYTSSSATGGLQMMGSAYDVTHWPQEHTELNRIRLAEFHKTCNDSLGRETMRSTPHCGLRSGLPVRAKGVNFKCIDFQKVNVLDTKLRLEPACSRGDEAGSTSVNPGNRQRRMRAI
jgi:hypothetical protein